jgi:DNA-binding CsgD family transcriptional regulator
VSDGALTGREIEVLQLCADGLSDGEIAERLGISPYTVGNHVRRILRKTDSTNRAQAVGRAVELSLIGTDPKTDPEPEPPPPRGPRPTLPVVSVIPQGKESRVPPVQRTSLQLIEGLQRALTNPSIWNDFLLDLASAYGSHLPLTSWTHLPSHGEISITQSPTMGEDWIRRYDEQYARLNPMFLQVAYQPGDFFTTTDDMELPPAFTEHPFYREYLQPLDMQHSVAWTIFPDPAWSATVLLGQSKSHGPVKPSERELGILLFPHIRHTLQLLWKSATEHERLARATVGRRGFVPTAAANNGSAGVMLLNRRGRVILANEPAEELLKRGHWLVHNRSGLAGPDPRDTSYMREAIARAAKAAEHRSYAPPATLLLRERRGAGFPLRMSITPFMGHGSEVSTPVSQARVLVMLLRLALH